MGLSIHYSGTVKSMQLADALTEELSEICDTLKWETHLFNGINEDGLKGISFSPEGSEPVWLCFLPGGRLCSPINFINREIFDGNPLDKELLFSASTKTQYAGADAHIAIIKLLKYISKKYLQHFSLMDEGNYWETGGEKILYAQFKIYNQLLVAAVTDALSDFKSMPGETPLSLAGRIEKNLNEKFKNDSK